MRWILFLTLLACEDMHPIIIANNGKQFPSNTVPDFELGSLSPNLWFDFTDETKYTFYDNDKGVFNSVQSKDSNAFVTVASSGGLTNRKGSYSLGKACFHSPLTSYSCGLASSFNYLHNGSAWYAYIPIYYIAHPQSTQFRNVCSTNGTVTTNANVGFKLGLINSVATPHTLRLALFNGAGGANGIADITCPANTLIPDAWNVLEIIMTGTTLTINVKNSASDWTQVGIDSTITGLSSSDAFGDMKIGVDFYGFEGLLKHIFVKQGTLSTPNRNNIRAKMVSEIADWTPTTMVYAGLGTGQSNMNPGTESNNSLLPSHLQVPNGSKVFYCEAVDYANQRPFWAKMEPAYAMPSQSNKHNVLLPLSYLLSQVNVPLYSIFVGRGATNLRPSVGSIDWSVNGGGTTGDLFPIWTNQVLPDAIKELRLVKRKTVNLKFHIYYQGENDASLAYSDRGNYDSSSNNYPSTGGSGGAGAIQAGDEFTISVAGASFPLTYKLTALVNAPGQTATNWYLSPRYIFQNELELFMVAEIAALQAMGLDTSKMQWIFVQVIASGPSATKVNNSFVDLAANFFTYYPSEVSRLKSVHHLPNTYSAIANHLDNTGFQDLASDCYDLVQPYLSL